MVRKSIEKLYTDICNIYEYQKVKNPVTKRTEFEPVLVHENVKCRISFKNITTTNQTTGRGYNRANSSFVYQSRISYQTKL